MLMFLRNTFVQVEKEAAGLVVLEQKQEEADCAAKAAAQAASQAEAALAEAQRVADAIQVLLQMKRAQGVQSQTQELEIMAQKQDNEVHRCCCSASMVTELLHMCLCCSASVAHQLMP
jgi:hypothetical protein